MENNINYFIIILVIENIPIDTMCENHNSMSQSNTDVLNYIRNAETFMKKLEINTKLQKT